MRAIRACGNNAASAVGKAMWYGPLRFLQRLLFHTPIVYFPIFVSETYHDRIRWPLKESKIYEQWKRETGWGRLFTEYQQKGCLLL
jgi:hypothetical protein